MRSPHHVENDFSKTGSQVANRRTARIKHDRAAVFERDASLMIGSAATAAAWAPVEDPRTGHIRAGHVPGMITPVTLIDRPSVAGHHGQEPETFNVLPQVLHQSERRPARGDQRSSQVDVLKLIDDSYAGWRGASRLLRGTEVSACVDGRDRGYCWRRGAPRCSRVWIAGCIRCCIYLCDMSSSRPPPMIRTDSRPPE